MLCAFDGHRAVIHDMVGHVDAWRATHADEYGGDENMIAERLWPTIGKSTLVHTEFDDLHGHGGVIRRFSARRAEGLRFIGERIYEDNQPNGNDRDCYVAARLTQSPIHP